jgi:NAD(P)-dependent dehydrogenase (short-subunit alcohol dehydrogenase family)
MLNGGIMNIAIGASPIQPEPQLAGQTVVVIGGSAGIGLETARLARAEGAKLVLAARNPERLQYVASELAALHSVAFDATDFERLAQFFGELPSTTTYWSLAPVPITRRWPNSISKRHAATLRPICFFRCRSLVTLQTRFAREEPCSSWGGTGGRRTAKGFALISALTAAMPAMTKNLALELAPVRVNLIAAGFVDTPLSASLLGNQLDARREQLRNALPIGRVVGPADIAALAVHLMTNTAVTGATYDIDGGQQLVEG